MVRSYDMIIYPIALAYSFLSQIHKTKMVYYCYNILSTVGYGSVISRNLNLGGYRQMFGGLNMRKGKMYVKKH